MAKILQKVKSELWNDIFIRFFLSAQSNYNFVGFFDW